VGEAADERRRTGARRGPDEPTQLTPLLPRTIADGRYRVSGQLGVGGMGVVLRAKDETLDREVAVKMLADNLSLDEGSRTRFLREARAAAAITDPRVVGVYDVGEQDGRPFLVMECVDGASLAEILAEDGPLPGDEVLDVATDALAGLGRAHDAGLLHRDVKPGNLLRAPDGTTKVTDFGVAIAVDGDRLTRTGFVIGTAAYLAPERRRGEPATVRTDLWALGATLTELLTGEPPGDAADAVLARRRSELPPRLLWLVRRLLAADPDDRPQDALEALEVLAGDPASSHAATPPPGIPRTELLAEYGHDTTTPTTGTRAIPSRWPTPTGDVTAGTPANGTARRGVVSGDLEHGPAQHRSSEPFAVADEQLAGPDAATAEHTTGAQRPRVPQLALLAALVLAAVLAIVALVDSGQEGTAPEDGFGPVVVDPADPAGTVRELSEQLRDRAGR
jgi:eukaryotic-like serine/threonine-protein kinase